MLFPGRLGDSGERLPKLLSGCVASKQCTVNEASELRYANQIKPDLPDCDDPLRCWRNGEFRGVKLRWRPSERKDMGVK